MCESATAGTDTVKSSCLWAQPGPEHDQPYSHTYGNFVVFKAIEHPRSPFIQRCWESVFGDCKTNYTGPCTYFGSMRYIFYAYFMPASFPFNPLPHSVSLPVVSRPSSPPPPRHRRRWTSGWVCCGRRTRRWTRPSPGWRARSRWTSTRRSSPPRRFTNSEWGCPGAAAVYFAGDW